jgi:hypothetical protein
MADIANSIAATANIPSATISLREYIALPPKEDYRIQKSRVPEVHNVDYLDIIYQI